MNGFIYLLLSSALASPMKHEFRGFEFGSSCALHEDFDGWSFQRKEKSNVIVYKRQSDTLTIGEVALRSIEYYCWRDQLLTVDIQFASTANETKRVLSYLRDQWGSPGVILPQWWEFRGVKTFAELQQGRLSITSQKIHKMKNSLPDGGI